MTTSDNTDKFDLAVRLLEHDPLLTDHDISRLMQDAEVMRIYHELQNCHNAVLRTSNPTPPDVDKEWSRFCRRTGLSVQPVIADTDTTNVETHHWRRAWHYMWRISAGIAASLLIVLTLWHFKSASTDTDGIVAFLANDNIHHVTLQTGNGNTIDISEEIDPSEFPAEEVVISKANIEELAYTPAETITTIDTHLLSTPRGKDYKITLEDGTTVWLNAESSLQYPTHLTGDTRHVRLKGEAYFKVAKNPDRPFIITTERMDIRVLGTELNIKSYAEHDSHVTLVNGSVAVTDRRNNNHTVTLVPGQDAHWMAGKQFAVSDVDTDVYVYWKDGYFYFDNKPLVDVMEELGRWYNFNVVFENKDIMATEMRFFCVRGQSPQRAVELLNNMKKVQVTLRDNTVYIR